MLQCSVRLVGAVYLAEQTEPVRRQVALKLVKPGMDTQQVIARFNAERQALAMMDHPHIAQVLDGGQTDGDRPYFVMELVDGQPITDYCDDRNLSVRERLALFAKVCLAIHHAHQREIVHRDIKPSNVLIASVDGQPIPKVIDFGIAKAIGQPLNDISSITQEGQLIGTPQYMSPEQVDTSTWDVGPRSDVYSLGVLLYELLTGTTPLEEERLHAAAPAQRWQMVRDVETQRPSIRLASLGEQLVDVAQRRDTQPTTLRRLIHGDLDWIVIKALQKDPS